MAQSASSRGEASVQGAIGSLGADLLRSCISWCTHAAHVEITRGRRKPRGARGREGETHCRGCMSGGQANGPPRLSGLSVIQSLQRQLFVCFSLLFLSFSPSPAFLSRLVAHMSHRTMTFIRKNEFAGTIVIDFCYFLPKNAKNVQRNNSALERSRNNIMFLPLNPTALLIASIGSMGIMCCSKSQIWKIDPKISSCYSIVTSRKEETESIESILSSLCRKPFEIDVKL